MGDIVHPTHWLVDLGTAARRRQWTCTLARTLSITVHLHTNTVSYTGVGVGNHVHPTDRGIVCRTETGRGRRDEPS